MKHLDFYLITDTHYFEKSLGCSGEAYEKYMKGEQMCLRENQDADRAVFSAIAADKTVDTVFIAGDLSKNGEYESHISLTKDLKKLKDSGKKIYLITAGHDFNDNAKAYSGSERIPVKGTTRDDLFELYHEFGLEQALAVERKTHSYVAKVGEGFRLLALNVDSERDTRGSISDELQEWITEQINDADAAGETVIAMEHYPLIPQQPIFDIIGDARLKQWKQKAAFLADSGVHLMLTGHMHAQSIKRFTSDSGNSIVDIQTSASVGYPAKYRRVTIDDDLVKVRSYDTPDFVMDDGTKVDKAYFLRQFSQMIPNKLASMLKDGDPNQSAVQKRLLKIARSMTVGKAGRLLCLRISEENKKMKVTDFAVKIVLPMFGGDPKFGPESAVYKDIDKALRRVSPVLSKLNKKLSKDGETVNLRELILSSLYNSDDLSDNDCEFKI
ncbi:MAG: metallophosphoesterase [Clostridia bacterium]|nr:metallophosphoesterase [Clostridia bacterium]